MSSVGLLAIAQASIAATVAVTLYGLDIEGDPFLLIAVAVADAVLGSTLGLFVGAFARSEVQAVQFMPAFVFPQVLLGGIFLSRDDMPDLLYAISEWLPLSHAIDALRAVSTGSEDTAYLVGKLLIIGAFALGVVVLGSLTLRRRTP